MKGESSEPTGGDATVEGNQSAAEGGAAGDGDAAPGGRGGHARVVADRSRAFGGRGGRGGASPGMPGQDVVISGDDQIVIGGDGGEAGQIDGRGGRGARIDLGRLGLKDHQLPDGRWFSEFGRGGDGGHSPQYAARLMVLEEILGHRITENISSCPELQNTREKSFVDRLNNRLESDAHRWRVRIVSGCFRFDDV